MIERAGIACPIVTGGSTGTYRFDADNPGMTELQPGSFVFMDMEYGQIGGPDGSEYRDFKNALTVVTTVVSRPTGMAIVDGGYKAFSTDRPFTPAATRHRGCDVRMGRRRTRPALHERRRARPEGRRPHRIHAAAYRSDGQSLRSDLRPARRTRGSGVADRRPRQESVRWRSSLQRELEAADRRRSPFRSRLARALFHRRQRLPDRTARRRIAEVSGSRRPRRRHRRASRRARSPRAAAARRRPASRSAPASSLDTSKHLNRVLEIDPGPSAGPASSLAWCSTT